MNYIQSYPYSAVFYLFILLLSSIFAFVSQVAKGKKSRRVFLILVILTLAIPSGLRDISVGKDTWAYIQAMQSASKGYSGELFYTYFEFGFRLLLRVLMLLVNDPNYVMLIISLIINTLIVNTCWFFKDKISFSLTIFCYFTMFYFETYNILRQWLAIAIVFFAIRYLFKEKYLRFIIFIIIAVSMHTSAAICFLFIPMHILITKKIAFKYKIGTFLLIVICLFFSNYLKSFLGIDNAIQKYMNYYINGGDSNNVQFGYYFILSLLAIFIARYLLVKNDYVFEDNIFIKDIIALNFIGVALTMLGYLFQFAGRVGTYAMVYEIFLFSMISRSKTFSILIKFSIVLLGLYLFYRGLDSSSQGQMPYKLYFK